MALARRGEFQRRELNLADFAKVLGHPARIAILTVLAQREECNCGDLVLDLPLAQSTVSQHLKALKEIGLIRGTIDGPKSRYCIDWKVFDRFQKHFGEWFVKLGEYRKDNFC